MRKLMNTLYVTSEDAYISLENENVVAWRGDQKAGMIPLHTLSSIEYFGYKGASPALMGECASRGIALNFYTPTGRFRARVCGHVKGLSSIRKEQYQLAGDEARCAMMARSFILGKIANAKCVMGRAKRDHSLRVDCGALESAITELSGYIGDLSQPCSIDHLRGVEGAAARCYFQHFDLLIIGDKEVFSLRERSKRPPTDPVNAMLSFGYALLANDCASALEGVGLDPYAGFMHSERAGRKSLALDLMEELRCPTVDRVVLKIVNNRMVKEKDFIRNSDGSVTLSEQGRKVFIDTWQKRKKEVVTHSYLKEKMPWGIVPHVQAQLLSRYLRKDIDGYPPFLLR